MLPCRANILNFNPILFVTHIISYSMCKDGVSSSSREKEIYSLFLILIFLQVVIDAYFILFGIFKRKPKTAIK